MKKVLVITPVFNGEDFIRGAIESILQQDYPEELLHQVIIDDCSTDGTIEEVKKYLPSKRITLLKNKENKGTYYSRNRGLQLFKKKSKFDIVTNHDADDLADLSRYRRITEIFTEDPKTIGVIPRYMRISNEDINNGNPLKGQIRRGEGTAFYNRLAFQKLGYFDNTRYSGDTDYWLRAEAFCKVNEKYRMTHFTPVTYLAVNHGQNLTTIKPDRSEYIDKVVKEVEQMKQANNFYRPFFE